MIEIPPMIQEDLNQINSVAEDLKMKIYIVGGFPRDIIAGVEITEKTDLDLTEKNGNAFDLAFFVAAKFGLSEPVVYESSGTALVTMPSGRPVEFHNAFYNVPHIIDELYALGIEPTPMNKDVYCRDFTINTLLFDIETQEISDPTKQGIPDLQNKILRTPLSPRKTLAINPKIILRGIRFMLQFGLKPDPSYQKEVINFVPALAEFMRSHPQSDMVKSTIKKTVGIDANRAIQEYKDIGLLQYIPKELVEMRDSIKEELFGTTITPTAIKKKAQTDMVKHLMEQREKHKEYMRRKRREQLRDTENKFDILEKARTGYFSNNPEPDFMKTIKEKGKKRNVA